MQPAMLRGACLCPAPRQPVGEERLHLGLKQREVPIGGLNDAEQPGLGLGLRVGVRVRVAFIVIIALETVSFFFYI